MQKTSDLYQQLLAAPHKTEVRLAIGETGSLVSERNERITIGGFGILVGTSGADAGYSMSSLIAMKTTRSVFAENTPSVGNCISGEITVEMYRPTADFPRQARLAPYVRLTDGVNQSEWIPKGVYFVDTREYIRSSTRLRDRLKIHGYDAIIKTEQDYPSESTLDWPAKDIDVVREIAALIDVDVDGRTVEVMTRGYTLEYPATYSCREVLGFIAGMYGGNFIMSDTGELRLLKLNSIPAETRYLVDGSGNTIMFGGVRIRV